MSDFLHRFAKDFSVLNASNLHRLGHLYSHDVHFRDPLHEICGLKALHDYFEALYANVIEVHFDFHGADHLREGAGYLRWTMRYRHPRLRGGRAIEVQGCSYLEWHQGEGHKDLGQQERVYLHQDYFDAGALLYEHVPLMGSVIGWLKRRLA